MYFYSVSIEMLAVGAGAGVDKAWARDRFIVLIYRRRLALCVIYARPLHPPGRDAPKNQQHRHRERSFLDRFM